MEEVSSDGVADCRFELAADVMEAEHEVRVVQVSTTYDEKALVDVRFHGAVEEVFPVGADGDRVVVCGESGEASGVIVVVEAGFDGVSAVAGEGDDPASFGGGGVGTMLVSDDISSVQVSEADGDGDFRGFATVDFGSPRRAGGDHGKRSVCVKRPDDIVEVDAMFDD